MNKKSLIGMLVLGIVSMSAICFADAPHHHRSQIFNCESTQNCLSNQGEKMEAKKTLVTMGEVVAIEEDGLVTVKGEGDYDLISLRIVKDKCKENNCGEIKPTQIYDSKGKKVKVNKLETGMKVQCYYDTKVTRSRPGQANAKAIIVVNEESACRTTLLNVSSVTKDEAKGYVTVEASNNEIIASIGKNAYKSYDQISAGDEVLVWYEIMTMSLPPRTSAKKAIVL